MRALFVSVFVPVIFAQTILAQATTLANLLNTTVNAVQTDAAGNIYIAGSKAAPATVGAFVAKLSPAGQVIWSTSFAGSKSDSAQFIALDTSGAAYIFGQNVPGEFSRNGGGVADDHAGAGRTGICCQGGCKRQGSLCDLYRRK